MYSNKFRRLRPLASASPAQTAQPLLPELRPHPPPKRTTEGIATMCAAETPRLRPHPPPKRTTEGIATMWEFQYNNKTSFKLPPIFGPSQARGLCPYPQAQGLRKPIVAYGNSTVQFESDLYRQKRRSEFLEREKRKEALCPQRQHPSQDKSAFPKRELKATKAPDANRVQLKSKEPEALERKVSEPKIEREEMALTEPEEPEEGNSNPEEMDLTEPEEPEEGNSNPEEMDLTEPEEPEKGNSKSEEMDLPETEDSEEMDRVMDELWKFKNSVDEFYENDKVIKCHQDKIEKMKEKADRIKEEIVKIDTLIKKRQEELKKIQVKLEKNPNNKSVSSRRKIKQISEKLAKVFEKSYCHFGCPDFLLLMLNEFEEWSFELEENTPAEILHKQQMEFWKDYYKNIRVKEKAELEALKEERWQRRREQALERALAPPMKIVDGSEFVRRPGKLLQPTALSVHGGGLCSVLAGIADFTQRQGLFGMIECKRKWKVLRDAFARNRKQKNLPSGSAGGSSREWKYEQVMSFLLPHMQSKSSRHTLQLEDVPVDMTVADDDVEPELAELSSSSGSSQWSYCYLQKYTAPGKKQPIRARRSALAVSIKLLSALITPLSCTVRTGVQIQDYRCAAALLMADKQSKLPIPRVAPAHKIKTGKRKKTDDDDKKAKKK
ncbi:hypothetical protein DPX16_5297 [Anabarilius grahami]|uniref:MADF domain-containing protein n=1 Tax=Anabarilius grahami TaxID=495550 RepID=A0A3N0XU42_ANAGA|nr:hypothetical protein DPX16_5297 [Anabarilius grahami]